MLSILRGNLRRWSRVGAGPRFSTATRLNANPLLAASCGKRRRIKLCLVTRRRAHSSAPKAKRATGLAALSATISYANAQEFFVSDGLVLGYRYEPSPIIVPDGTPTPVESVSQYAPTARPGSRAPHAWLAEGRSTLDLFGNGFVLLAFGSAAGDASPIVEAARVRGMPLKMVAIEDGAIAKLYERRLVLVRPDGHVAWRDDAPPKDPLALIDRVRGAAH